MKDIVILTGEDLSLYDIHIVCCHDVPVALSEEAKERILTSRKKKFAPEIMELSDRITRGGEANV